MDAKRVEVVNSALTYIGYAAPSVLTTDAKWQIKKIEVIGNETVTSFARSQMPADYIYNMNDTWNDDSGFFNKVWVNRTGYTYTNT